MRALVYPGNRTCQLRQLPDPVPGSQQAVIEVKAAGICGSDLGWYRGTPEDIRRLQVPVASHEPAGIVREIGDCVSNVKVGDRVAVYHKIGCGACYYCRSGKHYFCSQCRALSEHINGAAADLLLVEARNCLPMPADMSFAVAALLMCAGGTAFSGIRVMKPSAKDIALIFGLGPIGLLVATYLEAMQVHVVGVEINEYRAELARRIGVEHVLNPTRADLPKEILQLTAGEGVDQVYECTGKFEVRRQTTGPVRKGGKICLIGMYEGLDERYEPDLIGMEIILKELSLVGVNVFSIQHYWDILEFARRRAIDFGRIITHRFPLERAAEAFALADSGNCGKVILEP